MSVDILIVDDEADIRGLIKGILEDEGYSTANCGTSEKAYQLIEELKPSLIILDIWLQGSAEDGLEILKKTQLAHPYIPVLMISGHGTIETAVSAIKDGAYDFIEKPFKADRLLLMIKRALEASALKQENAALRMSARTHEAQTLTGDSAVIEKVRQVIKRAAPTNSRILLTGEAGTGKNIVARLIHQNSDRSQKPYLIVNCATLMPERLEAELFGNPESEGSIGLFEQANGGTLLLDEVADLSLASQAKIVRVLQDRRIRKARTNEYIDVDVRILAITNKDLQAAIHKGEFREDLYYRLNVVPLAMPSLKERSADISRLIEEFVANVNGGVQVSAADVFDQNALKKLKSYSWPGNLRQLRNVIEWMFIMYGSNDSLPYSAEQLPAEIAGTGNGAKAQGNGHANGHEVLGQTGEYMDLPLREARESFEREYLLSQIERFKGNISKTAQFVGMERSALHRKLKSLKINDEASGGVASPGVEKDAIRKRA